MLPLFICGSSGLGAMLLVLFSFTLPGLGICPSSVQPPWGTGMILALVLVHPLSMNYDACMIRGSHKSFHGSARAICKEVYYLRLCGLQTPFLSDLNGGVTAATLTEELGLSVAPAQSSYIIQTESCCWERVLRRLCHGVRLP